MLKYTFVLKFKKFNNYIIFNILKVRDDEVIELETLARKYCHVECQGSAVNVNGKVSILLQTYLARGRAKGFSLISDLVYISQVKFFNLMLLLLRIPNYLCITLLLILTVIFFL